MIISLVSIEIKENNEDADSYLQYTFAEEEFVVTELVTLVPILLYFLSPVLTCSSYTIPRRV